MEKLSGFFLKMQPHCLCSWTNATRDNKQLVEKTTEKLHAKTNIQTYFLFWFESTSLAFKFKKTGPDSEPANSQPQTFLQQLRRGATKHTEEENLGKEAGFCCANQFSFYSGTQIDALQRGDQQPNS